MQRNPALITTQICALIVAMCGPATRTSPAQVIEPRSDQNVPPDIQTEPVPHELLPSRKVERPDRPTSAPGPLVNPVEFGPYFSFQVNVDASGNNITGDAANEPSLAIDPTDPAVIVVGWRQFDTIEDSFRQAGWAASSDGGHTWSLTGVHQPGVFRSDPVLDADNDGNIHYYSLTTIDFEEFPCDVFTTSDGGMSWGEAVPAFGGDKAWMVVDRTTTAGAGNVYAKWQTFFGCCGFTTLTRSTDLGQSFEFPVEVPGGPSFGTLAVGPDGEVYVAGIEMVGFQNFNKYVVSRSDNAWNPNKTPVFELENEVDLGGSMGISNGPNPQGLLGQAWVAVDHTPGPRRGFVYVLGSVVPPSADPMDIMFARSEDGGITWSDAVRVNDDDGNDWQWFGTMSVAPDGRIDVVWNDNRASGTDNIAATYYAYSFDAGQTWSRNAQIGPEFDSHVGWPQQNKLGDYYDMISDVAAANLAYATTYNGEQDVWFVRLGDCNDNGVHDGVELLNGTLTDLDDNGVPDQCEGLCATLADCADLDGDDIRDDNCVWWVCAAGSCQGSAIPFADMGGGNGACPPDLTADGNDLFHALNCFSNQDTLGQAGYPCEASPPTAFNVDAGGEFGSCQPDGVCDGNDAFAALNAFAGLGTCTCPQGPAPQQPTVAPVEQQARIVLQVDRAGVQPGDLVHVDVRLASPLHDLRGYQLHLGVSDGAGGQLQLVDIAIHDPHVFSVAVGGYRSENAPVSRATSDERRVTSWSAFNLSTSQVLSGLHGAGVATGPDTHLATFTYRPSRDAAGTFTVELLYDHANPAHRTFLFPTPPQGRIAIAGPAGVAIRVDGGQSRSSTAPLRTKE